MNNPLSVELALLRQRELQEQAQTRRQTTVTSHNSPSNVLNTVLNSFTNRLKQTSTADEQAHLAWVADQA